MNRTVARIALALIVAITFFPVALLAQPAPAASAARAPAPVTPDTACGAGGTGDAMRYTVESPNRRVPVRETRQPSKAQTGQLSSFVDGAGIWQACRMPPKAKDCPAKPAPPVWTGEHDATCKAPPGAMLPGRNVSRVDVRIVSAGYNLATRNTRKGALTYECQATPTGPAWVLIEQYCQ